MSGGVDIGLFGALIAGLISFATPCVLPLVPPYLCFLGGVTAEELERGGGDPAAARRIAWTALAFVLGFTTVFVAMGLTASVLGQAIARHFDLLSKIAGIVLIVLGLHLIGLFKLAFLYRDARFQTSGRPASLAGAYVVGLAFAFGWSPCVGPALAGILLVAGAQDTAWQGGALLLAYSAGIGVPFLLAALAIRPFLTWMRRFRRHLRRVEMAMGALLIATGILFLIGAVPDIANWLLKTFPFFERMG